MVQEKKQTAVHHEITIAAREKVNITGVTEVISAAANEVNLATSKGKLIIRGTSLSMGTLDVRSGELSFTGVVNSIEYKDQKSAGAGFARLFR